MMFSPRNRSGNVEALGVDVVQAKEALGEITDGFADRDPLLFLVQMDVTEPVRFHDGQLLVLPLAQMRVDHHGAVVARVNPLRGIAVLLHRPDDAVELPGRRRAAREEEVPGDVDLERGVGGRVDHVPVPGEVEELVVVAEHRARRGPQERHHASSRATGRHQTILPLRRVCASALRTRPTSADPHARRRARLLVSGVFPLTVDAPCGPMPSWTTLVAVTGAARTHSRDGPPRRPRRT